ncbi:MAG: RNA-binding transcriptional accessory protein [Bacteroidales bacterium]|nr:RNA-binding transcriptional accessory protein [Bacteroidales bacterium]
MDQTYTSTIAGALQVQPWQVSNTLSLFENGATIPFISRYRKEKTGNLDEMLIANIQEHHERLKELDKRRDTILKTIEEQGQLSEELEKKIRQAPNLQELEDLYLPYKPKKRTRATKAREKGLEPLATFIYQQDDGDPLQKAAEFAGHKVTDADQALQGARDIIAEWVNEDRQARNKIRKLFHDQALVEAAAIKGKEEEGQKYKDYFEWSELLRKTPSHRYLAIMRGEKEGILRVGIGPDKEEAISMLEDLLIHIANPCSQQVTQAIQDSYKRLMAPSMENEMKAFYKEKADDEAIRVFAENLRQLLLAPPLGQKRVMAIDPGFRTGCKIVCLDEQGNLLYNETIYPHKPQEETRQAAKKLTTLSASHRIQAIAIGNGTASRETEQFIRKLKFDQDINVFTVSEDGASVYSASQVAREEFPDYDVTVRGAVSIGRRLMDPLAELVKIDPKSIGVGQYQHDVDQNKLKNKLNQVVESCVNLVGVNVNTASKHLLTYVSGLGPQLAGNMVEYRKKHGPFRKRKEFKHVKRMGDKAFQQCAGFLRIPQAANPLDNSAVHPESYPIVEKMASDTGTDVKELIKNKALRDKIDLNQYVSEETGLPTLKDILAELEKPGRDPRQKIQSFDFDQSIRSIEDLRKGMILPGIINNITNFGAFVDIGIKHNGLIHISNLANRYVSNPADIVKLHQHVRVKVIDIDIHRGRIQLSLKDVNQ